MIERSKSFFSERELSLSLILGMAVIAPESPPWIIFLAFFILLLRAYFDWQGLSPWSPKFSVFVAILLIIEVLVRLKTLISQDATITLVLGLTALRIMDYRSQKDRPFLVLLGFVLFSLKPLFALDLYWLAPCFLGFFGLWLSMYEGRPEPHRTSPYRFVLKVFVLSLPVTFALFLLFPRFILPWAKEQAVGKGRIGFSERLRPGSLAELAGSDELAFRVRFLNGAKPRTRDLYWRGGVLENAGGLDWSPGELVEFPGERTRRALETEYEVLREDLGTAALFLLETPVSVTAKERFISYRGGTFKLARTPNDRMSYLASSYIGDTQAGVISAADENEWHRLLQNNLNVPDLPDRTKAFVQKILSEKRDLPERKQLLDDFFSKGGFEYTLKPGEYSGPTALDDFLFVRKKGFCEHFAASYATLARALAIPARVVIGFHGGSQNAYGSFWEVHSNDAHAWVEVLMKAPSSQLTWQRVDPTYWIAPRRLELGGTVYFQLANFFVGESGGSVYRQTYRIAYQLGVIAFLRSASDYFSNLNFIWVNFMLNFNLENQYSNTFSKGWFFFVAVFAMSCFALASILSRPKANKSLLLTQRLFLDIQNRLNRKGIVRAKSTPPVRFLHEVASTFRTNGVGAEASEPLEKSLIALAKLYTLEVYQGQKVSAQEVSALRRDLQRNLNI